MFDALQIAATGMNAQQLNVDTIANNLVNVNTTGYKKARITFSELVAAQSGVGVPSRVDGDESPSAVAGRNATAGVTVANIARLFDPGDVKKTDSPYDVTIAGDGFFEVAMSDGQLAYSRGGTLRVNDDGQLATLTGHALKPGIQIPEDVEDFSIGIDGKVFARAASQRMPSEVGQLDMVRFLGTGALESMGDNLFRATAASGEPIAGRAGRDGMGSLRQGFLEASNVKLVDEMVNLMVAQRAYEASVKVVQASDEMLGLVNNLRR